MPNRLEILRRGSYDHIFMKNLEFSLGSDDVMSNPYKKSELAYICISTTARAISQVPMVVTRKINAVGDTKPLSPDHEWNILLRRPNFYMDRYSFVEAMIGFLMLDGNVFIVPFPPGLSGVPKSLWIVKKKFISPRRHPVTGHLIGWTYDPSLGKSEIPNVGKIDLDITEVIHIFFWNPNDMIMGQAPHEAGEMSIVTDYKAAVYNKLFFEQGARTSGILTTPQKLGTMQFERTKAQVNEDYVGYKRAHKLMVLEQGLTYTQTGISQVDMDFKNLRDFNASRIYQIYGMKKAIISETADVNYATAKEQRREWWTSTNLPLMKLCASALNFGLFEKFGSDEHTDLQIEFDISVVEALQDSLRDKIDAGYRLFQMGFTPEQVNRRLNMGFEVKPWHKYAYMQIQMAKVNDDGTINYPSKTPNAAPTEIISPSKPKELSEKTLNTNVGDKSLWKMLNDISDRFEDVYFKKISRVLFEMRRKILDLLYNKGVDGVRGAEFREEFELITKAIKELCSEIIMEGIRTVSQETGRNTTVFLSDAEIISFISLKVSTAMRFIDMVKSQLISELDEGLENKEGIEDLAVRFRKIFDLTRNKSKIIAGTEVMGSLNFGRWYAAKKIKPQFRSWITPDDESLRDSHGAMHNKTCLMENYWSISDKCTLRFPGDPLVKDVDEILNCRCVEKYIMEE
jgi:HK97 family phage portal protein